MVRMRIDSLSILSRRKDSWEVFHPLIYVPGTLPSTIQQYIKCAFNRTLSHRATTESYLYESDR